MKRAPERIAVIVQARLGSSRLPGKVLRHAGGRSLLAHLITGVRDARRPTLLCVATTEEPGDDPLAEAALGLKAVVHRGPTDDVLGRFVGAGRALGLDDDDLVVRLTADCPLLPGPEIDRIIEAHLASEADYTSNQDGERRRIPRGFDVEVMSFAALRAAEAAATSASDREHVTPWLRRRRTHVHISPPPGPDRSHLRLTVDTWEDLRLVERLVEALGPRPTPEAVFAALDAHPEWVALNAHVAQRAGSAAAARREAVAGQALLLRADGGPEMGFGHLTRMEALAEAWAEAGGQAVLVGCGLAGPLRTRFEALGVVVEDASTVGRGDDADVKRTRDALARHDAAALVVDGYGFASDFFAQVGFRGPRVLIWDDGAGLPGADLYLCPGLKTPPDFPPDGLHGPPYLLLRREFQAPLVPEGRRIVASFGGSDVARLTEALVERWPYPERTDWTLDAILGPGVSEPRRAELAKLERPGVQIRGPLSSMLDAWRGAGLAVIASGVTTWELMGLGLPFVAVPVVPNQAPNAEALEERDLAWVSSPAPDGLLETLLEVTKDEKGRQRRAERLRGLVDGRGAQRLVDAITACLASKGAGQFTT